MHGFNFRFLLDVSGRPETVDLTRGQYRRIYAGFLTDRRLCAISIGAEAWYWRIHAVVDDFGNALSVEREDGFLLVRRAGRNWR